MTDSMLAKAAALEKELLAVAKDIPNFGGVSIHDRAALLIQQMRLRLATPEDEAETSADPAADFITIRFQKDDGIRFKERIGSFVSLTGEEASIANTLSGEFVIVQIASRQYIVSVFDIAVRIAEQDAANGGGPPAQQRKEM